MTDYETTRVNQIPIAMAMLGVKSNQHVPRSQVASYFKLMDALTSKALAEAEIKKASAIISEVINA